ncbi:MAG: HAMP domain-containing histidine kinase, partial [bacterium]|nr:HAMP domain-containing histidine kinase [bacterium]MDW8163703.1 HAMP domain-containing sensor histidine kinase [Candidatus Omnitrophota bacterium]
KYNEIKKIQKELLEKEKFVAIGKVASFVTHEIRNPLVKIGGFSRQILETDDQDKIKRNIKIIYNEILQLEKVFDRIINLISFSEISIEEVNIYDLIKEVIEFLNDEIKEKNIEIVFDLQPIWLKGDSIQLKEVFFNIIKNAVENNKENGKIIIKGEITGKYFKITIEDTGIGISEEDFKNVGKPFFSKKKSGLGLGLTVAKEIVERHKGELMIESKINEGTKVKIFLPMEVKNE